MEVLDNFVTDLDVAMISLRGSVQLKKCTIDLSNIEKPSDYANAIHNPEMLKVLEGNKFIFI